MEALYDRGGNLLSEPQWPWGFLAISPCNLAGRISSKSHRITNRSLLGKMEDTDIQNRLNGRLWEVDKALTKLVFFRILSHLVLVLISHTFFISLLPFAECLASFLGEGLVVLITRGGWAVVI